MENPLFRGQRCRITRSQGNVCCGFFLVCFRTYPQSGSVHPGNGAGDASGRAQDARNGWEGHCKIPWIPFLPERLALIWMEEFGVDPALCADVVEISQPQVTAILEELGCRVVVKAQPPHQLINGQHEVATEEDVRRKAREIRLAVENAAWQPQPENLYIYARKMA